MPNLPETPTVFVVEDDAEVRDGLRFHLSAAGFRVAAHESAEAFLAVHTPDMAGCVVADMRLPGMDGISLIEVLTRRGNRLPVIVVSGFAETARIVQAMRAGAVDYLEKPLDPPAVLTAIQRAMQGASTGAILRSEAAQAVDRLATLTRREREVLDIFASGANTKQAADTLGLSPKTVESYRVRLFDKLAIHTPSALVRLGVITAIFGDWRGENSDDLPPSGIS